MKILVSVLSQCHSVDSNCIVEPLFVDAPPDLSAAV